jgi:hypothetical protein
VLQRFQPVFLVELFRDFLSYMRSKLGCLIVGHSILILFAFQKTTQKIIFFSFFNIKMRQDIIILGGLLVVTVFVVLMAVVSNNKPSSEKYGSADPVAPDFCNSHCQSCYNYYYIQGCRTNCQAPSRCGCDNPDVDCYDTTLSKLCQNSPNYMHQCTGG